MRAPFNDNFSGKSKHNHNKSYRTQCINGNIAVAGKYIKLPKLGYVKAKISMPVTGKINNATIEQVSSGKYFCVFNVEAEKPVYKNAGCVIGIDVGIKEFYSDSNGKGSLKQYETIYFEGLSAGTGKKNIQGDRDIGE